MNVQISLPDEAHEFIEAKVASGQYASPSEVVVEALRVFEIQQQDDAAKLKWLQDAWREGIESGDAGEIDFAAIKARGRDLLKKRAAE